ncbi:unnamed protein product [Gongylonema pulchrum]|uniref:Uncharacterized protein n=1 Tax=Gongylonema pulchrum TaxID=637853 RepID=A0A183F1P0_9BILA|nr:unnamed protein product [Gongylonema pulchrum]
MRFGIVQYKKHAKEEEHASSTRNEIPENVESENSNDSENVDARGGDPLLVIVPCGERYNLIRQLESFEPPIVILYHSDLVTLRLLEMYKACNNDKPLTVYIVMYGKSNEEERYLCALRKEQIAFEELVREQGVRI